MAGGGKGSLKDALAGTLQSSHEFTRVGTNNAAQWRSEILQENAEEAEQSASPKLSGLCGLP